MQIRFFHRDIEHFITNLEKPTVAKVLRVRGVQEVRFFYVFHKDHMIVVLHGFIKNSQQIPKRELRIAETRKKQVDSA